ncbi:SH3 domain-containing protein [Streptomyces sp. NPDC059466]|uniref:SH3 domain-containing protein n=1 Tax=unclassified Streptomyces TaxID=2593676 RepID=UPI0036AF6882
MKLQGRRSVVCAGAVVGAFLMVTALPVAASADGLTTYPTAPGASVNVRSGPGTGYSIVRVLPTGSRVVIFCQTPGEKVSGYYGTSNIWDNVGNGEYVADAYVKTGSDGYIAPRCA